MMEHVNLDLEHIYLDRCPYCGGKARITRWLYGFWPVATHKGGCLLNDMEPPAHAFFVTPEKAAAAWNMRYKDGK